MTNITDPVIVCNTCGEVNEVYEPNCACGSPLDPSQAIERSLLGGGSVASGSITVTLSNLSLETPHQPTADEAITITDEGEFVVGRDGGGFIPEINVKGWSKAFVSQDPGDPNYGMRQRGISRKHAIITINGDEVKIASQSSLGVQVNGNTISGAVVLNDGDVVALGDIFPFGSKPKAPGVIFRVAIS